MASSPRPNFERSYAELWLKAMVEIIGWNEPLTL
jgi:hypothetical protein